MASTAGPAGFRKPRSATAHHHDDARLAAGRRQTSSRSLLCVLALSPVLLLGLALLYDRQIDAIVSATHATLMRDGELPAGGGAAGLSLAGAANASTAALPVAAAAAAAPTRGASRRAMLGDAARNCFGHGTPARSFIMVFMGHSGSSAVMSELRAHSGVQVDNAELVDHGELQQNTTAALAFVREFFTRAQAAGRVPGFKMRPRHIRNDPAGWRALTREFGTRVIWNYRTNLVKQAVGEYSYKKLGDQSVVEGLRSASAATKRCTKGVGCTFRIEDMEFFHYTLRDGVHSDNQISEAAHLLSAGNTADEARLCIHELPYEDYLYERRATMDALYGFLGLKVEDTSPARYKATKDNMCEVVENWDELCRNFYSCFAWRAMMDDERNGCTCKEMGTESKYCSTKMTKLKPDGA